LERSSNSFSSPSLPFPPLPSPPTSLPSPPLLKALLSLTHVVTFLNEKAIEANNMDHMVRVGETIVGMKEVFLSFSFSLSFFLFLFLFFIYLSHTYIYTHTHIHTYTYIYTQSLVRPGRYFVREGEGSVCIRRKRYVLRKVNICICMYMCIWI